MVRVPVWNILLIKDSDHQPGPPRFNNGSAHISAFRHPRRRRAHFNTQVERQSVFCTQDLPGGSQGKLLVVVAARAAAKDYALGRHLHVELMNVPPGPFFYVSGKGEFQGLLLRFAFAGCWGGHHVFP